MDSLATKQRSGQVMLIAVISLGSAILGATAIAGFLMVYQIKQTTNFVNSAQSIFAADAGIEWAEYEYFQQTTTPAIVLSNGATVSSTCYDASQNAIDCSNQNAAEDVSKGYSGDTARAFLLGFNGVTSTGP